MRFSLLKDVVLAVALVLLITNLGECEDVSGSHSTPQIALEWKLTKITDIRLQLTGILRNAGTDYLADLELSARVFGKDGGLKGSSRFVFYPKLAGNDHVLPFGMMIDMSDPGAKGSIELNLHFGVLSPGAILPGFTQFNSNIDGLDSLDALHGE